MKKILLVVLLIININIFAQELSTKSEDGFELKGWLEFPQKNKKLYPIAVFAHEFGSDHTMWSNTAKMLRECGYATFVMDLRGHGKSTVQNGKENKIINDLSAQNFQKSIKLSEKKVNFKNIPMELALWLEKLSENENIDMDNLVLFGSSLGGSIIPLFIEFEPKLAVLYSPAGAKAFGEEEVNESILNTDLSLLIFSSQGDFALQNSLEYAKKALRPTLVVLPGSGHGSATFDLAMPYLKTYLAKYLEVSTCR